MLYNIVQTIVHHHPGQGWNTKLRIINIQRVRGLKDGNGTSIKFDKFEFYCNAFIIFFKTHV